MPAKAAARTMRGISDGTPAKPLTRQVNSMSVTPLSPEQLYTRCDVTRFTFETTEELRDLDQVIGQERALEAIHFGASIGHDGYNLFVLGPSGTGKRTVVKRLLREKASGEPVPPDWIYLNNFETPHQPRALPLPTGQGRASEARPVGAALGHADYELSVRGPSGTGKRTVVKRLLREKASGEPVPPDWIYLNNFETPHQPRALPLPTGQGRALQAAMRHLVDELRTAIPAAFESEDYRNRRQALEDGARERQETAFQALRSEEHTSELQSLMRISYAGLCLK